MTYSQKYALVHFVAPINDGEQFHMTDWPLHITLADVFAITRSMSSIDAKLAAMLSDTKTVQTTATDDGALGMTPVVLLDKTPQLMQLHMDIVTLLEKNGAEFNNPEFTKSGFVPHCTIQKRSRLQKDSEITIDSLSLIDMFPGGDWQQRKIVATFSMGQ